MLFKPLRTMLQSAETRVLAVSALVVICVGTAFYMWAEGWTPVQSLYFCVVTLATVGFGDLHPTSELSQLFTIGYILTGIGIIAGFVSELAKLRSEMAVIPREVDAVEQKVASAIEDDIA